MAAIVAIGVRIADVSWPVGLVLAGGRGSRLGGPKGQLRLGGMTLAERAALTLAAVTEGVLVSVAPGGPNPAPGYPVIEDRPPAGMGPLAGIAAAYSVSEGRDLLVLACDYPRVGPELLRALLGRAAVEDEIVLVRGADERDHPLVGLWRGVLRRRVDEAVGCGALRVSDLVAASRVRRLGPRELSGFDLGLALVNVNRPEDLE